jgi:quinol monooxygenase YgiN
MTARKVGLVVNGTLRVHPDDAPTFAKIISNTLNDILRNPAVCYYSVGADVADRALFHIVEGWTDREALTLHNQSEEHQSALREVGAKVRLIERNMRAYKVTGEEAL